MVTGEIKNKIDQIWDTFWTAGVTNPITVLEQMTYLFFMKMLDDKQRQEEQTASLFGNALKDPTFPKGKMWMNPETKKEVEYEQMRWHVFKETSSENMYHMVSRNVFVFIKNIGGVQESAYSKYMKNAIFLVSDARKLQKLVDDIDALDMNKRDAMGDVYEYVLGKMAASGKNGQFRTPRHIINMMVSMMKPTPEDTICDPAMGSAGFLMSAARYIKEHYKKELMNVETKRRYNSSMFSGYDSDETMLRIGAMNMLLHGVVNPHIDKKDSVSDDNTDQGCYSLVLANPPFTGSVDKETIAKNLLTLANTNKTELLYLSLFIRSLEVGGRCASIVPDGVLFGSTKAHQAIRKEIVDNQQLRAVVSLPSGVFLPYSGVSTAVLVFTKTNCGGTQNVWFYDMKADGYTLDQKRTECKENDIPDVLARWENLDAESSRSRKDQSFMVPVDEIRANGYDLSFNKYREVERERIEYEAPDKIFARIEEKEAEIARLIGEYKAKFL